MQELRMKRCINVTMIHRVKCDSGSIVRKRSILKNHPKNDVMLEALLETNLNNFSP